MSSEIIANRYIVLRPIGSGGMADVYLAIDKILRREVAVKVLRGDLANDPVNLARFQKEALAITNTSHPNIVEVFDVGEDNGRNFIVMEYVRGKTLKQLIKSRGVIAADEAVNIMKQLVSATEHAHRNGIIHRDIKSQNVLIKDDGTVKLSDFGIAYTGDATQLTQAETVMGSVHYLAPELAQGHVPTIQSDIYSLGIVFYEMLTGDVPFHGDTAVEIALKHMHNDVPFVRDFDPSIPQAVENVVIKATARNQDLRYKNATAMYNDIVTCLDLNRRNETRLDLSKTVIIDNNTQKKVVVKKKKSSDGKISMPLIIIAAGLLALVIFMAIVSNSEPKPKLTVIPQISNLTIEEATEALQLQDIDIKTIIYEPTDNLEKGLIIRTVPEVGTEIEKGTAITIYVSKGISYKVGNYVGKKLSDVEQQLKDDGFTVITNYVTSMDYAEGTIMSQDLQPERILDPSENRIITFDVSSYASFTIPSTIITMDIEDAVKMIEELGGIAVTEQLDIEGNLDEHGDYIHPLATVVSCSPDINSLYTQAPGVKIILYYY